MQAEILIEKLPLVDKQPGIRASFLHRLDDLVEGHDLVFKPRTKNAQGEERARQFAVEPNDAMRAAAENSLGSFPNFQSVNAAAEATTLADRSVDFVTAAQAFHWFEAERAVTEFARILRDGGWVVLLWNVRRTDSTPFQRELERILRAYGTDYERVAADNPGQELMERIFPRGVSTKMFRHEQIFDYEGLRGRWLSASYVPLAGHPNHEPMFDALRRAFDEHNTNGTVAIEYDAVLYYSQLS